MNLPQNSNASANLPISSLTSADKIMAAISSFGEDYRDMIFYKYRKSTGIEKAITAKAPTFHDVSNFWGEKATSIWLRLHIAETFAFLGIYDCASKYQIQQTADLILSHEIYGQLTLSEFLCFLNRFKQGRYGKIYQSNRPNPQEFLMCLQPFWNELSYERGKQEEKERIKKNFEDRNSSQNVTYEEYCRMKGKQEGENPLMIKKIEDE